MLVDVAHDARFGLDHDVRSRCIVSLPKITIAVRGAAHDADLARSCAVPLPPTRPLEDLSALVFGDHALKLHQQLILGGGARRGIEETGLDPVTSEAARIRALFDAGFDRSRIANALGLSFPPGRAGPAYG